MNFCFFPDVRTMPQPRDSGEFSRDVDIIAQSRKHKKFFCQDKTMCGLENKCQANFIELLIFTPLQSNFCGWAFLPSFLEMENGYIDNNYINDIWWWLLYLGQL